MNSNIILHHYEMSPFSEKVRLMLGYCDLSWQSVLTSAMPPRPLLLPLAGGYRRIPVAQIGADVFCDTQLITAEIARLANCSKLEMINCSAEQQDFIAFLDSDIFMAEIAAIPHGRMLGTLLQRVSPLSLFKLIRDRANMAKQSNIARPSKDKAQALIDKHIVDLNQRLQSSDFLFGDEPSIADFSAYHSLWFYGLMARRTLPDKASKLCVWYAKMAGFGHGQRAELSARNAISIADNAEPRPVPEVDQDVEKLGTQVFISPSDYGMEPVTGILLGSNAERWIVARQSKDCGNVHVHFPKRGYQLS
jgi:glutathione S-transferase